jgi:hypothetical protein
MPLKDEKPDAIASNIHDGNPEENVIAEDECSFVPNHLD